MEFLEALQLFWEKQGFSRIKQDGKILWMREDENQIALVEIVPWQLPGQPKVAAADREKEIKGIENRLMIRFQKKVDRLTLMVFSDMPDHDEVQEILPFENIWCLDWRQGRVLIYESQRTDFLNMKEDLERFIIENREREQKENREELKNMLQPVTMIIVAVNVAVFVFLSFLGDVEDASFMARHGAMTWQDITQGKEYYRLLTSSFLHFGADHLLQNMLLLALVGTRLERIVGKARYAVIYGGSAIGSAAVSLMVTLAKEPYSVSAGASGAVFGILGGLLFLIAKDLLLRRRKHVTEIGLAGILFMIMAAASYGFFAEGIDNAAHLGGLAAGFVLTGILSIKQ